MLGMRLRRRLLVLALAAFHEKRLTPLSFPQYLCARFTEHFPRRHLTSIFTDLCNPLTTHPAFARDVLTTPLVERLSPITG